MNFNNQNAKMVIRGVLDLYRLSCLLLPSSSVGVTEVDETEEAGSAGVIVRSPCFGRVKECNCYIKPQGV